MHTWLPIHVEIPAEHPVVYANYACPILFIIVNYMYQSYEQMNKVLQGHWERMTICQYIFHSIIHVGLHSRCFSLRQTFETVHMCAFDLIECFTTTFLRAHSWLNWVVHMCAIESTGHPEEACTCSLQPKFLNEVKSVFMIMTGMGNSFMTTVSKLITLDTPGACISCVRFPNL